MTTILIHNWSGSPVRFSLESADYVTPPITVPPSTLATFPYYYRDDALTGEITVRYGSGRYPLPLPRAGARQGYLGWLCDPGITLNGDPTQTYSPGGYRVSEAYLVWRDQYSAASANIQALPRDLYLAIPSRTAAQLEQMTQVPTLGVVSIVTRDLSTVGDPPPSTGLWNVSGQEITLGGTEISVWLVVIGLGVLAITILFVSVLVAVYTSGRQGRQRAREELARPCVS